MSRTSCPTSIQRKIDNCGRLPAGGLRIRLLGPLAITLDGRVVPIASRRARALLGYLALREGAQISRTLLTGLLWGERSESQARASLRQTLSELRAALAPSASHSDPRHQGGSHLGSGIGVDRCQGSGDCRSVRGRGCTSRRRRIVRRRADGGSDRRRGELRTMACGRARALPSACLQDQCAADGPRRKERAGWRRRWSWDLRSSPSTRFRSMSTARSCASTPLKGATQPRLRNMNDAKKSCRISSE